MELRASHTRGASRNYCFHKQNIQSFTMLAKGSQEICALTLSAMGGEGGGVVQRLPLAELAIAPKCMYVLL